MKKYNVYYQGNLVTTIKCEKIEYNYEKCKILFLIPLEEDIRKDDCVAVFSNEYDFVLVDYEDTQAIKVAEKI